MIPARSVMFIYVRPGSDHMPNWYKPGATVEWERRVEVQEEKGVVLATAWDRFEK